MFVHLRNIPTRLAAGSFILNSGLEKWHASEEQAKGMHAMASGAYPFLAKVEPPQFLKALSIAEIATGAIVALPIVPNKIAGAVLTAFSGGLVGLYLRTPDLHKPGTILPNQAGIAISKDIWMLGIGVGLLAEDSNGSSAT
jgi:uncharacterized membrane protein YkgB